MPHKLETKFIQMFKAIAILLIMKILTELSYAHIINNLIEKLANCGPLAPVVLFQPEIRKCLRYLGRIIHTKKQRSVNEEVLISLRKALHYMAKRKIGALITLERHMDLEEFVDTGTKLNADITGELLINIFTRNAPLHDGAVIIRSNKIVSAGSYLPLTKSAFIPRKYGTRHRAAIGISEVNDSLTVVVSEETGEIGIAFEGAFLNQLTIDSCLEVVRREMSSM